MSEGLSTQCKIISLCIKKKKKSYCGLGGGGGGGESHQHPLYRVGVMNWNVPPRVDQRRPPADGKKAHPGGILEHNHIRRGM